MVFQEIYEAIRETNPKQEDETLIIGIGGNTGSGKSSFTREFAGFLKQGGIKTLAWGNDFYQASRSEKNRKIAELLKVGADKQDNWWKVIGEDVYYSTYDRELLEQHLTALRQRKDIPLQKFYDSTSGEWNRERSHSFDGYLGPFWVLHDGVYLFHPKVRPHLDRIVLLTTGDEKLVSDPELGEVTEERRIRFDRVAHRARTERGYDVSYAQFLPLDIHTTKHIRDGLKKEENLIIVENKEHHNRRIISPVRQSSA